MASTAVTQTIESLFGPPSELINVADFIESASLVLAEDAASSEGDDDVDMDIAQECRYEPCPSLQSIEVDAGRVLVWPISKASLNKCSTTHSSRRRW